MPASVSSTGAGAAPGGDQELVRSALDGDDGAIEAVLARLSCIVKFVFQLDRSLGYRLPTDSLEDVVQQVYAALWPRLRDFHGGASLESWAFGFCRNCLRAEARRRASHLRLLRGGGRVDGDVLAQRQPAPEAGPAECAAQVERIDALRDALDALPAEEREVVALRHLEDWSFERIARERGIAPSTVKDRCYRAVTRLQHMLREGIQGATAAGERDASGA